MIKRWMIRLFIVSATISRAWDPWDKDRWTRMIDECREMLDLGQGYCIDRHRP
jgi:hypothetical protein